MLLSHELEVLFDLCKVHFWIVDMPRAQLRLLNTHEH